MASTELPREKLKELLEKNGESLLQDRDRCEGLLKDYCGTHRREISAIVGAMEERVPLELKSSWQTAMTPEAMRARLVQRLEENRGLAPEIANYAVETWSYALGVSLGRISDLVPVPPPAPLTSEQSAAGGVGSPVIPVDNTGKLSRQNKAIVGGIGLLAASAAVFALLHHPKPAPLANNNPPPQSQTPSAENGSNTGGNASASNSQNPTSLGNKVAGNDSAKDGTSGESSGGVSSARSSVKTSVMPAGTLVVVQVDNDFNSDNASLGDMLPATVVSPLTSDGNVVVPQGAGAQIKVIAIDTSGQLEGKSHVLFALVALNAHGKLVRVTTTSKSVDGPAQEVHAAEKTSIGGHAGAAIGAIKGHLFHHAGSGATAGTGAGGATGASPPKPPPVKVSAETVMQFRLKKGLALGS